MTTEVTESSRNLEKFTSNLAKIEDLTQRLIAALQHKRMRTPALEAPGQELYGKAASAFWAEAMANPTRILEQQAEFWGKSFEHYVEMQKAIAGQAAEAPEAGQGPKDRRFANPLWQTNPYFNFVKRQYETNVEAMEKAVQGLEGLAPSDKRRIEYFTHQIIDMMAPTNFLATNPDALERAVATEGDSLVKGLENLVRDVEANHGDLLVTLSDKDAFAVGTNIGTSEGGVVFRNRMFELIQYAPTTEKVHKTPLIVFPPWINKFYILDLKPANSLIKWIVDQGFTLFVVSWKNPDASYADVGMDDYVRDGYLAAIEQVKQITGEPKVNAVGYCIAGTTLTATLGLMNKRGDKSVNSATFFTTLTDFSEPGEIGVFLDDDFVGGIEETIAKEGYLDKFFMARTFSFLRANDLIYTPAIRSYMLGEAPPAFDLLYWNGDGTNLPGRMCVEYLRQLCQQNHLIAPGFDVDGERVTVKDVKVPVCAIACETDHIAPWKSSYNGIRQFGSRDKTFILSESGHIAGIVNPPGKDKYGHYTNEGPMRPVEEWKEGAGYHKGSWWPRWRDWLAARSGRMVPARALGDSKHKVLAPAPGTYVSEVPAS
ncbi:class I poly(R)-hydroxyalkanoic acid synthase [Albidovulum sediminicola]|uniref:Class I poly(R)-hydroxyalkanoic acid synthase n=1 Tax=Albidovulum sediminicola TaxID=2984331 RepID=A0ABT2Z2T1_9RHOB|nr:class I poly(R)-hydroxyalkanoic acid synthase [Defluviimonas sp. WL0075]MCV2865455.1 class I poly(R)-hydroxyalkanoic acid synthase [Defluviimonas sp. WL0075]